MKTETVHRVTLTNSELEDLIRGHLGLSNSDRVFVTIVMDESQKGNLKTEWLEVPTDWERPECPTRLPPDHLIEVAMRNGCTSLGRYEDIMPNSWYQENHPRDILRYRFISTKVTV